MAVYCKLCPAAVDVWCSCGDKKRVRGCWRKMGTGFSANLCYMRSRANLGPCAKNTACRGRLLITRFIIPLHAPRRAGGGLLQDIQRLKLADRVLGIPPSYGHFAVFGHSTFRSAIPNDLKCHFD